MKDERIAPTAQSRASGYIHMLQQKLKVATKPIKKATTESGFFQIYCRYYYLISSSLE